MEPCAHRLFVYGTLLAVSEHPLSRRLVGGARRLGAGHIQGRLYVVTEVDAEGQNRYPAAVPSADPADRVWGEVWHIEDQTIWPEFDAYEACSEDWPEPHEFLLRRLPVVMDDGQTLWARAYLYSWDLSRAELVASGRFAQKMPSVR